MSDTLTLGQSEPVVRQPHQRREPREPDASATIIESGGEHLSPEAALADSQRQLQDRDRQVADARRQAREADQRRAAAETEVVRARETQAVDRQAVVAQALEGAKSEQSAAKMAKRAARESGDIDAEMAADEALGAATFRASQATAELDYLKTQPKPAAHQQQQGAGTPSAAAQKWLDDHPRYFSDEAYQATAQGAHGAAIRAGNPEGSAQYISYIDQLMTRVYGEGHGQPDDGMTQPETPRPMAHQPTLRQSGSTSVPPSRAGNGQGAGGGWRNVETPLGSLLVQNRPDGTRGVRFPNAKVQSDFEEGASLDKRYHTGEKGRNLALAEYTNEQLTIAAEIAAGGNGDLVRGEGRTFGREVE